MDYTPRAGFQRVPVINSPADIYKYFPRRTDYEENLSDEFNPCSISPELEEPRSPSVLSNASSGGSREMDRELLQGYQRTLEKLTQRFMTRDININKFYVYDRDDIDEWLNEFDYQLEAREISPDSKTALTQLTIHIAGPAREYIHALPPEQRTTVPAVKEALRSCYSRRNREWVQRQAVTQRQHKAGEPVGDYVSDMVSRLNKLEMLETSRVYHFVEGLQPEFQRRD